MGPVRPTEPGTEPKAVNGFARTASFPDHIETMDAVGYFLDRTGVLKGVNIGA